MLLWDCIYLFLASIYIEFSFQVLPPALYCGQEFENEGISNYVYPNMFYRGVPRHVSPPWRPDNKDGHYVFAVGENLTSRCEASSITSLNFVLFA